MLPASGPAPGGENAVNGQACPVTSVHAADAGHQQGVVAGVLMTDRGHHGQGDGLLVQGTARRRTAHPAAPSQARVPGDRFGPSGGAAREQAPDLLGHAGGEFHVLESWSGYALADNISSIFGRRRALLEWNSPALTLPTAAAALRAAHTYVWFYSGSVDKDLLTQNLQFADELHLLGIGSHYVVVRGGHDWALWRAPSSRAGARPRPRPRRRAGAARRPRAVARRAATRRG